MKRSLSVSRVVSHPSTLAVFPGLLGALIGFLLNRASGGKTSQLIWIALVFAMLFILSLTAWQVYRQEKTGRQWMTMLQEISSRPTSSRSSPTGETIPFQEPAN